MRGVLWLAMMVLLAGLPDRAGAQAVSRDAPPASGKAGRAKPASAGRIPSHQELRFGPLRPVKIPEVVRATLPNGMRLFLVEDHELPVVNGFAIVRTGSLFDPPDKIGLASITGTVMRTGGTAAKTGEELDEQLENIAASVEAGIGDTSATVSFSALKENVDEVLEVFRDVLTAPEFRQHQIDLARTRMESAISRRNDDASSIASREFEELIYGRDNPHGWRMEYEHLARIERADLQAFHRRYFFPANTMVAVYGDFKAAEMKARLEELFDGWRVTQPPVPEFPPVKSEYKPGIYYAVKPDVTQSFFRLGHLGGKLSDKDYPALEVMADILGGGFTSRLFRKVRTEMGYAYGVGAAWAADYLHPGVFRIAGSTKSASTAETLRVIEEEVERIRRAPVSAEELKIAKDTVLNSFVFNFDTPSKTLNRIVRYEYYGYPEDFIFRYQKAVEAVTVEDVQRVARQYLQPEKFAWVVVGNPKDFGTPLEALGKQVAQIDLTIPQPGGATVAATASEASVAKGIAELKKIQNAVGGKQKLAAVRDALVVSEVKMQTGGGEMAAKTSIRWMPGAIRQEQQLPFGKMAAYFDGTEGWFATPQGTQSLPDAVKRQLAQEQFRFLIALLMADECGGCKVVAVEEGLLEISSPEGGAVRLVYDPATGMPLGRRYQTVAMMGAPQQVEEKFTAWQETDGLKLPVRTEVYQAGKKVIETQVTDVQLNTGVQLEELKKKP